MPREDYRAAKYGRDPFSQIPLRYLLEQKLREDFPGAEDVELREPIPSVKFIKQELMDELTGGGSVLAAYLEGKAPKVVFREDQEKRDWRDLEKILSHEMRHHLWSRWKEHAPSLMKMIARSVPKDPTYYDLVIGGYGLPPVEEPIETWRDMIANERFGWAAGGPTGKGDVREYKLPEYNKLSPWWRDILPLFLSAAREPRAQGE